MGSDPSQRPDGPGESADARYPADHCDRKGARMRIFIGGYLSWPLAHHLRAGETTAFRALGTP
jgi:hypothetical protein